jgi:hypothetical protein
MYERSWIRVLPSDATMSFDLKTEYSRSLESHNANKRGSGLMRRQRRE